MKKIEIGRLYFETEEPLCEEDSYKLRGFFGRLFPDQTMAHNHMPNSKQVRYHYPELQYKVIRGRAFVVAIGERAVSFLPRVLEKVHQIEIGKKRLSVIRKGVEMSIEPFGISNFPLRYEFITPWLALNSENYKKYRCSDQEDRSALLTRCLNGNLLSTSRYLDYKIEKMLDNSHDLESHNIHFKGETMIGFTGIFYINFHIPDFMGLGKGSSRGQGCCVQILD